MQRVSHLVFYQELPHSNWWQELNTHKEILFLQESAVMTSGVRSSESCSWLLILERVQKTVWISAALSLFDYKNISCNLNLHTEFWCLLSIWTTFQLASILASVTFNMMKTKLYKRICFFKSLNITLCFCFLFF